MPHAFLTTTGDLTGMLQAVAGHTELIGDTRIKFGEALISLSSRTALVPCLAIEPNRRQWFYIQIKRKGPQTYLLRLDPTVPVVRTVGVRLAIAYLAVFLSRQPPGGQVATANIREYFAVLEAPAEVRTERLAHLRRKIARQMRAAELRQQAHRFQISLDFLTPPLQWSEIFGRDAPVEIEIGPGKGKFLLEQARRHPERNFLGIEWAGRYLKVLTERIPRASVQNLRFLAADAREVFRKWIPPGSVARVHVYYPDPWWKKRHAKYRLFSDEFLRDLERALESGGTVHFATDVPRLFEEVSSLMAEATGLKRIHERIYRAGEDPPPGRTHFEIKKWRNGSDIFEAIWQKS